MEVFSVRIFRYLEEGHERCFKVLRNETSNVLGKCYTSREDRYSRADVGNHLIGENFHSKCLY